MTFKARIGTFSLQGWTMPGTDIASNPQQTFSPFTDFGAVREEIGHLQQIASLSQNSPSQVTRFLGAQEALATLRELIGEEAFAHLSQEETASDPFPFFTMMSDAPPEQGAVLMAGMDGSIIDGSSPRIITPAMFAAGVGDGSSKDDASAATERFTLRDYQEEACQNTLNAIRAGKRGGIIILPTGSGKTVTFSETAMRIHEENLLGEKQALLLVHRVELVDQAKKAFERVFGEGSVSVVSAGRNSREFDGQIVTAGVQTLTTDAMLAKLDPEKFGLVVVDEAHHIVANTYRKILVHLGLMDEKGFGIHAPGRFLLGVTATPDRADGVHLSIPFPDGMLLSKPLPWFVDKGYLLRPNGVLVTTSAKLSSVRISTKGDYNETELSRAMSQGKVIQEIVDAYEEVTPGERVLMFASSVAHAHALADKFNEGLDEPRAAAIDGSMSAEKREELIAKHKSGELDILTNFGVLTEGYDDPGIQAIYNARPTRSRSLYVQMIGRGLRPDPENPHRKAAKIVDVTGAIQDHELDMDLAKLFGMQYVGVGLPPMDMMNAHTETQKALKERDQLLEKIYDDTLPDELAFVEVAMMRSQIAPLAYFLYEQMSERFDGDITPMAWALRISEGKLTGYMSGYLPDRKAELKRDFKHVKGVLDITLKKLLELWETSKQFGNLSDMVASVRNLHAEEPVLSLTDFITMLSEVWHRSHGKGVYLDRKKEADSNLRYALWDWEMKGMDLSPIEEIFVAHDEPPVTRLQLKDDIAALTSLATEHPYDRSEIIDAARARGIISHLPAEMTFKAFLALCRSKALYTGELRRQLRSWESGRKAGTGKIERAKSIAASDLQPYQRDSADAIVDIAREGKDAGSVLLPFKSDNPIVAAETAAKLAELDRFAGSRILIFVPSGEAAKIAHEKLMRLVGNDRIELCIGSGLKNIDDKKIVVMSSDYKGRPGNIKDFGAQGFGAIITCGSQSAAGRGWHHALQLNYYGDNPHLSMPDGSKIFIAAVDDAPDHEIIGYIGSDLGGEVRHSYTFAQYMRDADVKLPRTVEIPLTINLSSETLTNNRDYRAASLERRLMQSANIDRVVEAYREHARRKPTIVYAMTEGHARELKIGLQREGARVGIVDFTKESHRFHFILSEFNRGKLDVLVATTPPGSWGGSIDAKTVINVSPTLHRSRYLDMIYPLIMPGSSDKPGETVLVDMTGLPDKGTGRITLSHILEAEDVNPAAEVGEVEQVKAPHPFAQHLMDILRNRYEGDLARMAWDLQHQPDVVAKRVMGSLNGKFNTIVEEFELAEAIGSSPEEIRAMLHMSFGGKAPGSSTVAAQILDWDKRDPDTRGPLSRLVDPDVAANFVRNQAEDFDLRTNVLDILEGSNVLLLVKLYSSLKTSYGALVKQVIDEDKLNLFVRSPELIARDVIRIAREIKPNPVYDDPLFERLYTDALVRELTDAQRLNNIFGLARGATPSDMMAPWNSQAEFEDELSGYLSRQGIPQNDIDAWMKTALRVSSRFSDNMKWAMTHRFLRIMNRWVNDQRSYEANLRHLADALGMDVEQVKVWQGEAMDLIERKGLKREDCPGFDRLLCSIPERALALGNFLMQPGRYHDEPAFTSVGDALEEEFGMTVEQVYEQLRVWRERERAYPWNPVKYHDPLFVDKLELLLAYHDAVDPSGNGLPSADELSLPTSLLFPESVYGRLLLLLENYLRSSDAADLGDRAAHYERWVTRILTRTSGHLRYVLVDRVIAAMRRDLGQPDFLDDRTLERVKVIDRIVQELDQQQMMLSGQFPALKGRAFDLLKRILDNDTHDEVVRFSEEVAAAVEAAKKPVRMAPSASVSDESAFDALYVLIADAELSEALEERLSDEVESVEEMEGASQKSALARLRNILVRHLDEAKVDAALQEVGIELG